MHAPMENDYSYYNAPTANESPTTYVTAPSSATHAYDAASDTHAYDAASGTHTYETGDGYIDVHGTEYEA